ncbi:hypothetical protein FP026_24875 [Rhizobium tropici]|uniref:Uncharacterized protein n=1 Tax=Rhizobium tropici TaxID=398 RepID=A0A5B0VSW3_RHITR|nr:hypothetical protein [Rhizobium tropici]KAA1177408.1 hypothetical protein FP026_24875 [Rhizobium tropici]
MLDSELLFSDWLTRQQVHWVAIDQSPNAAADGAVRVLNQPVLHRPDILALTGGFGTIAVDVKSYDIRSDKVVLAEAEFTGGGYDPFAAQPYADYSDEVSTDINYVRLFWSDIVGLVNFQKASAIPTWICIIPAHDKEGETAFFYRVDDVLQAFARVFTPLHDDVEPENFRIFKGWGPVELKVDPTISEQEFVFDFVIESVELAEVLPWKDWRLYVPPKILNLKEGTTLADLSGIIPALPRKHEDPTVRALSFANAIGNTLKITIPRPATRREVMNFIDANKAEFYRSRPNNTRR